MLLPSVLPCENTFRVSRSRTTTRSQSHAQRHCPSAASNSFASAVGLGLSLTPRGERLANSSEALHEILSLAQTPPPPSHYPSAASVLAKSRYSNALLATPTPSRTPSPQTPSSKTIPQHTPWTTPRESSVSSSSSSSNSSEMEVDTPRASASGNTYTYTIVTRNNKRKRTAETSENTSSEELALSTPRHLDPFTTPDPLATPTICPPAPKVEASATFHPETDDMLDDPFVTPKRSRLRGPPSKRICATRRNLGPWSEDEDKQLVGMVLAKMKLSERDWAECANTLGRDGFSVGERWQGLVQAGSIGLINDKRREEKRMRARLQGNGRGRLEPVARGKSGKTGKKARR